MNFLSQIRNRCLTMVRQTGRKFRESRMQFFVNKFAVNDATKIIDIGGNENIWNVIPQSPQVLLVNIDIVPWERGRFRAENGDGRNLRYPSNSFDIAFSNSVIEHVGSWDDQIRFAAEVRRMSPRYYVQTPNRDFFLEQHTYMPFLHFLPKKVARILIRRFTPFGFMTHPSQQWVDEFLDYFRLLNESEMRTLFPEAEIVREKFLGMTKSIIAIRV